ncbi:MAG: 1-acyl-sn-glycerol-3-phosphate acyltransferase [Tannerella sp.]|jgi:1-acyl-sn-glycerol-3-phosphate acyltransferase|nr:1-acyl-sn-glycerol-3-phosphate acyltransferase [Tannerella sp.]
MLHVLFKVYFRLIAMPVFAVITILTASIVAAGCILGGERFFSYYPGMLWARIACILTLCPVKIKGRENIKKGQSFVFVSNHQGAYDIFLIYGYLGAPIKWMMKKGLAKIPLVGFACRMAGFTFVDTSSARSAQKSVREAERNLQHGRSLIVFPEGSRTPDGHMHRFKRGAYQIAVDQQLPIIPITLNGPYKVLPIGSWDAYPHRMEMIIHPPVMPHKKENDGKEQLQKLVDTTQKTIYSMLWDEFK